MMSVQATPAPTTTTVVSSATRAPSTSTQSAQRLPTHEQARAARLARPGAGRRRRAARPVRSRRGDGRRSPPNGARGDRLGHGQPRARGPPCVAGVHDGPTAAAGGEAPGVGHVGGAEAVDVGVAEALTRAPGERRDALAASPQSLALGATLAKQGCVPRPRTRRKPVAPSLRGAVIPAQPPLDGAGRRRASARDRLPPRFCVCGKQHSRRRWRVPYKAHWTR
jgi:hypothetical protein